MLQFSRIVKSQSDGGVSRKNDVAINRTITELQLAGLERLKFRLRAVSKSRDLDRSKFHKAPDAERQ